MTRLLQAIESLFEMTNMLWKVGGMETKQLIYINHFVFSKNTIQIILWTGSKKEKYLLYIYQLDRESPVIQCKKDINSVEQYYIRNI